MPASGPSRQEVRAKPFTSVVALAGVSIPFPDAAEKATLTPSTGTPKLSTVLTDIGSGSTVPVGPAC
jgi:hypothetical protein